MGGVKSSLHKTRAVQPAILFTVHFDTTLILQRIRRTNHAHWMFDTHIIRGLSGFDSESAVAPSLGLAYLDEGQAGRQR